MICFLLHVQKWELAKKWMSDSANSENYQWKIFGVLQSI